MSKKQWLVLLMLFLTYLLLGASIFYYIESHLEIQKLAQAKKERIEINALLHKHYMPGHTIDQHEILEKLTEYCGKSVYNYTESEVDRLQWDFYNSFYFAYTVVSTIGYGNLAPTNMLSRILMIFYGLLGIPMNGILLTQLGEFFSTVFIRAHRKYKSYKNSRQCDDYYPKKLPLETRKVGLAAQIFMYLTPGFVMFIFFPAFLFSHYEGWSYDQSVYYAFVTLTTIGFGDMVAGQDNTKGSGPFFIMYKTFLICWISFGLGYIVMIMTFIARGMRSKKITRLEHKLAMNIKHTQSKIWNEFNKEVDYLRRVFNELQLSKVKRVYVDESDYEIPSTKLSRSNSFPDLRTLTIGMICTDSYVPPRPRRRANSEVVPADELVRVVSETDLQRIDKTATFAAHAMVQPAELLARLVNILGYIPPPLPPDDMNDWDQCEDQIEAQNDQYKTVESFSSAKQGPTNMAQWTIGGEKFPFTKPRSRATSEVRLQVTKNDSPAYQENSEWTWSGPAASEKLQELMNARDATSLPSGKDNSGRSYRFPSFALPISATKNLFPRWRRQSKRDSDVGPPTKNMEKISVENNEKSSQQNSLGPSLPSYPDERRDSILKRPYYTHTGGNLSGYLESNSLLEETSLADFLRALTTLHARVGTIPDEFTDVAKPKRKLGTASLTPPKLPSLFTLFSSGSGTQSNQNTITETQSYQPSRRVSLKTAENSYSGSNTPSYIRKESIAVKPRRFSLRPVTTPVSSPSTPPEYGTPRLSNMFSPRTDSREQEPYTTTVEPFISVSPKQPLVNMEGPLGISSPIKQPSGDRRFSIRPAKLSAQPSPTSTKSTPTPLNTPKPLPRWKGGMLQRQLGQLNIRRRTRAFSLSDVYSSKRERNPTPLSPLAMDNSSKFVDVNKTNQKTVTIMSPAEEMIAKNEARHYATARDEQQTSLWKDREHAVSVDPFTPGISIEPFAALNEPAIAHASIDRYHRRDGNHDKPTSAEESSAFQQRLVSLDTPNRTIRKEMQETNVDVKGALERKNIVDSCVIDNLGEPSSMQSSTSRESSLGLRKEKPMVPIDSYKPSLQVTIEKPAVNPFEQYRAMTRSSRNEDADLKEVKIEDPKARHEEEKS